MEITEKILIESLSECRKVAQDRIQLRVFSIQDGTKPGENFTSEIKRIRVEFSIDSGKPMNEHFMCKISAHGPIAKWWEVMKFFRRESLFYSELIPELVKVGGSRIAASFPRCFYTDKSKCILLEDLKVLGFRMNDAKLCLDLEHMNCIMDRLAEYHAYTYHLIHVLGMHKLNDQFKDIADGAKHGAFFTDDKEVIEEASPLYRNLILSAAKLLQGTIDVDEVKRVENFSQHCFDMSEKLRYPKEDQLLVISHGDVWNNNILFKYEDNKVVDLRFLDLQCPSVTRPTLDLATLIYQSTTPQLRELHQESLLRRYYEKFVGFLSDLGYPSVKLYPYEKFLSDFDDCVPHGLMMGFVNIQSVLSLENPVLSEFLQQTNLISSPIDAKNQDEHSKSVLIERILAIVKEGFDRRIF